MWCYFVATFTSPGYPSDPISPRTSRITTALPEITISSQHYQKHTDAHSSPEISITRTPSDEKSNIVLDENGNPVAMGSIMVKRSGEKRYCQKCQYDKPDRTHHCRVCKRLMHSEDGSSLPMVSEWSFVKSSLPLFQPTFKQSTPYNAFLIRLNNCIGFRNQKAFCLFIIWGSVYSVFITVATIPPTISYMQLSYEATIINLDLNISFLILIGGVFALSLLGFAIYHTSLLLSNQTTLESLRTKQNFKMREDEEATSGKLVNLFDVGLTLFK
ncbi:1525_t:CDS:2 [Acaulospora colombiana]|uniref:1525_t:CDS:1 n=1 Tax=Acaulospora colombiana TaxID=27376 RepID=A0ACA9KK99_9GLOM|nr:1525_t:CDS:2 [Acaulospora colombiana]